MNMKTTILFPERLRQLRKQAGLNQKQMGVVIDLSNHAICMMERGQRSTTIDKLVQLAEYFQVSTDYLLGITDDPTWQGEPLDE